MCVYVKDHDMVAFFHSRALSVVRCPSLPDENYSSSPLVVGMTLSIRSNLQVHEVDFYFFFEFGVESAYSSSKVQLY